MNDTITHPDRGDGLWTLEGPDARHFLQGQTTANFESAAIGTAVRGAFCNPKGRMLADFSAVVVRDDLILLRGRRPVFAALQRHLKPYLMFSKSELAESDWRCAVIEGLPTSPEPALIHEGGSLREIRLPRGERYSEIWGPSEQLPEAEALASRLIDIVAGEARIETETIGLYLPQDLNYDLNGAVSFNKGCYTGQEIVARLHFRGTPKRRLFRARCAGDLEPVPGSTLSTETSDSSVGSLVNCAPDDNGWALLIELKPDCAQETVCLRSPDTRITLSHIAACQDGSDQSITAR